jgi:hypothetical protein
MVIKNERTHQLALQRRERAPHEETDHVALTRKGNELWLHGWFLA